MSKIMRWLVVIPVAIMLVVASSGAVAAYPPFAHLLYCDPYDYLPFVEEEANEVYWIVYPTYASRVCGNYPKLCVIYYLDRVDLWHFAGGCEVGFMSGMTLITGDGGRMWGDEIPDLHDQWTFDRMRFAFANADNSGYNTHYYDLFDGFIDNGCEAYLGWDGIVDDYDAYVWATTFYLYAIDYGSSINLARLMTDIITDMPGTPPGTTSVLYGNGGISLLP